MVAEIARERIEDCGSWFLEEYGGDGQIARRHRVSALPFRLGRGTDADATLEYAAVSGLHAELYAHDGRLWLRDLGSSNGTYRNGLRVSDPVALDQGDILRVAHVEMLVSCETGEDPDFGSETAIIRPVDLVAPTSHAANASALRTLVTEKLVTAHFQPIVDFADPGQVAFELLGRGAHDDLPDAPGPLFEIAARVNLEAELSGVFCARGLTEAAALPGDPQVFVNTHPAELANKTLVASLRRARERHGTRRITVEIHEGVITDASTMSVLRRILADLDMRLAYDDFGAGQARILELVDAPPDYLKFDISLVRGIDLAPAGRQKTLESLVTMARNLGIACVAEGIETLGERETCEQMGFEYGQGFLLGRPAAAEVWLERSLDGALGS